VPELFADIILLLLREGYILLLPAWQLPALAHRWHSMSHNGVPHVTQWCAAFC
jgi:hypothetical protein